MGLRLFKPTISYLQDQLVVILSMLYQNFGLNLNHRKDP